MRLSGLTLETHFFEDYLSFLTEVLELDLSELTDQSMRLDLNSTWVEIRKTSHSFVQTVMNIEFALDEEDFHSLKQKIGFYYYRRTDNRFVLQANHETLCAITDPDGRVWRFVLRDSMNIFLSSDLTCKNL